MFDTLSERLQAALKRVAGQARLNENNIADAERAVRAALLDADVAVDVAREFVRAVRVRALGLEVAPHLNPGQQFAKLVRDELVRAMGPGEGAPLACRGAVLLVGLQGAGKTTTAAKLARWLAERERKSALLCCADVRRPAAAEQLAALARRVDAGFVGPTAGQRAWEVAAEALRVGALEQRDVVIVDSAGRLAVDGEMMAEARALSDAVQARETLFVVDAMSGQDAVNAAAAFHRALNLTGVVLSKADADARGGALLSARAVTGAPIKFIGSGERLDALERFVPERMASRILGQGDVLSLLEEADRRLDRGRSRRLARKVKSKRGFDLDDLLEQMREIERMGGVAAIAEKMPGAGGMSAIIDSQQRKQRDDFARGAALIGSMTPEERRRPEILNGSRKRRIARGAGCTIQDIGRLLKQHKQMQRAGRKLRRAGAGAQLLGGLPGQPAARRR